MTKPDPIDRKYQCCPLSCSNAFSPKSIRIIGDSSDSLGEFRVSRCPRFQATWQGEPLDPLCMCLYQYKSCQVLRSRMNNSIMIRPQVCSSPQQSVVSYTTTMQWQPLRGVYQQGLVDIEHSSETADNYGHLRSARRVPMTKYLRALLSAREHTENMAQLGIFNCHQYSLPLIVIMSNFFDFTTSVLLRA